jgi:HEAT repeat protein
MSKNADIQHLIDCLSHDYCPEAAQALEQYSERAIRPLLTALWQPDIDPYGHDSFAEILVRILQTLRHPGQVEILVSLLEHENADVRRRAVVAMGESRDPRVIHMLRIALYDRNALVGQAAAQALIAFQYSLKRPSGLAAALYDPEPKVRYYAVRQLEQMQATDLLIEATYNDDVIVRQIAIWYLGRTRAPQALPALLDALQDHDFEVRGGAAWALGNLGDTQAIQALLPLLHDREPAVAQLADDALYKLGYAPTA